MATAVAFALLGAVFKPAAAAACAAARNGPVKLLRVSELCLARFALMRENILYI